MTGDIIDNANIYANSTSHSPYSSARILPDIFCAFQIDLTWWLMPFMVTILRQYVCSPKYSPQPHWFVYQMWKKYTFSNSSILLLSSDDMIDNIYTRRELFNVMLRMWKTCFINTQNKYCTKDILVRLYIMSRALFCRMHSTQ